MYEDILVMIELADEEEDAFSMLDEALHAEKELNQKLEGMLLETLLSEEYDANNAILSLHSGAGGTEAQDWVQMLYRMYLRWAEKRGFQTETLDYLDGDEAGIKSVTVLVSGENAYGYLKAEKGVHRLVRISPFDSSGRRHTSFASVDVIPELPDDIQIDINPEDLKVDTYRASGAGGQHINKTESAIRITHIPTGIVVSCQNERSQIQNRETAMQILKSRLYDYERTKRLAEQASTRKSQIGSGDRSERVRTYNFPQGRVTDHRINLTLYKLDAFMDGEIDEMIEALVLQNRMELLNS